MQKPGYKTTEFWLTLTAIVVGAFLASGITNNEMILKIAGMAGTVLTTLGYQVIRFKTKAPEKPLPR